MSDTANLVTEVEQEQAEEQPKLAQKIKEYKYQAPQKNEFTVEQVGEHEFIVKGEQLERLVQMTNLDHQDGIMRLARKLKRLGVDDALREKELLMVMMWLLASLSLNSYNKSRDRV